MISTKDNTKGNIAAFISILIWGTTFVSSKVLLQSFLPIEIIFFRFLIGFVILCCVHPNFRKKLILKEEVYFALAGLFGVTLYFISESTALVHTSASNVGIIVSLSPFFTAVFAKLLLKEDSIDKAFFVGLVCALVGIVFLATQGDFSFTVNVKGDMLALLAGFCWGVYSIILKKISSFGHHYIDVTRHVFFYGVLFMIPFILLSDFHFDLSRFLISVNWLNMAYLAIGASVICFISWNCAVKILGPVKTTLYIYLVPIVSTISSVLILGDKLTIYSILGIVLILFGLIISQKRSAKVNE